jgi:23S rRNA (adenine2503-C2)-methyltransferase
VDAAEKSERTTRARRDESLVAGHDARSLAQRFMTVGAPASTAKVTVGKVLRHVFANVGDVPWDVATFTKLGIGAWAHATLLTLDPSPALTVEHEAPATDGTIRLLLKARDGALIESVLIPGPARTTLCVSSQVGCARACSFCETGRLGFERQLSAAEITDQVRIARARWAREQDKPALSNLVFMGMGEPFDNLTEVLRALELLTDERAYAFAPSRVTVSTVGVVDKLPAFFAGCRAELAVSLNAPDDERRRRIMPVNVRFPLATLRAALLQHLPKGRRVLFEYVLFDGVNDAPEDADLVAEWTRGIRCRVNVIPCNPGPDPSLRPPSPERLDAFVARLSEHKVTTLVRRPRGRDVGGACGQLAGARRLTIVGSTSIDSGA